MGYISTWSGYINYCELHPGTVVLDELERQLHKELGADTPKEQINMYLHAISYFRFDTTKGITIVWV